MKKKLLLCFTILTLLALLVGPVLAGKPASNLAKAQKVAWNLTADVMPVPPYGGRDIPGSDVASKLIVNQPNGAVEAAITGVMKGLKPNTEYTVYLTNAYVPYEPIGWNVAGSYWVDVEYLGVDYPEPMVLIQSGTSITGQLLGGPPSPYPMFTIVSGTVIGNEVNIYATLGSLTVHMYGTIAADGSMSGNWHDEAPGTRTGSWDTTSGNAVWTYNGNTGWTGLFSSTVQPFTFTTDEFGSGSWHLNLRNNDFPSLGTHTLSVWINGAGATILISDNFDVLVT